MRSLGGGEAAASASERSHAGGVSASPSRARRSRPGSPPGRAPNACVRPRPTARASARVWHQRDAPALRLQAEDPAVRGRVANRAAAVGCGRKGGQTGRDRGGATAARSGGCGSRFHGLRDTPHVADSVKPQIASSGSSVLPIGIAPRPSGGGRSRRPPPPGSGRTRPSRASSPRRSGRGCPSRRRAPRAAGGPGSLCAARPASPPSARAQPGRSGRRSARARSARCGRGTPGAARAREDLPSRISPAWRSGPANASSAASKAPPTLF